MDIYPPKVQHPSLLKLAEALLSSPSTLRKDSCLDWCIRGTKGHIYAVPEGYQIFFGCRSAKAWTFAKQSMSFARVCNDGDDEGGFILDRLPISDEAETIRKYCGILKKTEYSPEVLEAKRVAVAKFNRKLTPSDPTDTDPERG